MFRFSIRSFLFFTLSFALLSPFAFADGLSTSVESLSPKANEKPIKVSVGLSKTASLFDTQDGKGLSSSDISIVGSYKVSDDLKFGLLIERGYDDKTQEADWGRVSFSSTFQEFDSTYASVTPRVSLGLPANKRDFVNSLRARVSAGAAVALKTEVPALSLSYSPSLGYANFAYETSEFTGNPNSPFSLIQDLSLGYALSERISLKVSVTYLIQQTTSGFVKDAWTHAEELNWQVADKWALSLGHQFGVPYASTRTPSQDLNVAFINEKDSVIYTQLTVDF